MLSTKTLRTELQKNPGPGVLDPGVSSLDIYLFIYLLHLTLFLQDLNLIQYEIDYEHDKIESLRSNKLIFNTFFCVCPLQRINCLK